MEQPQAVRVLDDLVTCARYKEVGSCTVKPKPFFAQLTREYRYESRHRAFKFLADGWLCVTLGRGDRRSAAVRPWHVLGEKHPVPLTGRPHCRATCAAWPSSSRGTAST